MSIDKPAENWVAKFIKLPGELSSYQSAEQFQSDLETILGSNEAKKHKGIVYVWRASNPIPRLKGESDIIYIGKTKDSIFGRHYRYAKVEATGERNKPRFKHILKNYGSISFHVAKYEKIANDLKSAEKILLADYFNKHLEYPPLNRMGK